MHEILVFQLIYEEAMINSISEVRFITFLFVNPIIIRIFMFCFLLEKYAYPRKNLLYNKMH